MAPPTEPFSYSDLTEVYRREQRSKNITEVRKDLYVVMKQSIEELRRDSEREFAMDQFSTKAKMAANQLTKFQEKADQVFEFRMEKILAMGLRAAVGNRVGTERLTAEEVDVFERVSSLLRDRHAPLLTGPYSRAEVVQEEAAAPPSPPAPEAIIAPQPAERPSEAPAPVAAEAVKAAAPLPPDPPDDDPADAAEVPPSVVVPADIPLESVVLRILEDIPSFAGPDRNYDLKKEDLVSLPPLIARALVARKKAVAVQMAPSATMRQS